MSLGQMRSRILILLCLNLDVGSSTWLAQGLGEVEGVFPCSVGHLAQQMVPELQDRESGLVLLVGREEAGENAKAWDPHTCSCSSRVTRDYEIQELSFLKGFPGGASGKEYTHRRRRCQRCRFNPWVGKISWRRKWQPAPIFLPGESHGQRSLVGYSPWGRKKLDTIMHAPTQASQNCFSSVSYFLFFRERHTLPLAHTHTLTILLVVSVTVSLLCFPICTPSLSHTLTHQFCCVLCRSASTRTKRNFTASGSSKMVCGTKRDPSVTTTWGCCRTSTSP